MCGFGNGFGCLLFHVNSVVFSGSFVLCCVSVFVGLAVLIVYMPRFFAYRCCFVCVCRGFALVVWISGFVCLGY